MRIHFPLIGVPCVRNRLDQPFFVYFIDLGRPSFQSLSFQADAQQEMYCVPSCKTSSPQKNVFESKYGIIRSIFFGLRESHPDSLVIFSALRAIVISNDLYSYDKLSAIEISKRSTFPVFNVPHLIKPELLDAQETLYAKQKLAYILHSKTTRDMPISLGKLVDVYFGHESDKRGKWSSTCMIFSDP